jgi:acetate kinase
LSDAILTLNAGSSSLKFALYAGADMLAPVASGNIEGIGTDPRFHARDNGGAVLAERGWPGEVGLDHEYFIDELLRWVDGHLGASRMIGVGHRIVHGGASFTAPVRIDDGVIAALDALAPLAPLHQPHNLNAVRAVARLRPALPQVACFDTAFHSRMAPTVTRIALPREISDAGVRRYGFHGLSYEYIAGRLAEIAPSLARGRVIVAHLGNGASLCALADGVSMDTTMGFTPLDGLVMGTRCGAIDPGCLLYLMRERHMDAAALEDLLYRRSGLKGVSGISSDMRDLLASKDPRAEEAIDLFTFHVAREMAALCATLGGLDGLVFTAGIGENAPEIRRRICERAAWMGIALDPAANRANASVVSASHSAVAVWVIPTDEELMIARYAKALLG